ncbi:MAG: thiamine-phosphate kinase [Myxococcota bacterium]
MSEDTRGVHYRPLPEQPQLEPESPEPEPEPPSAEDRIIQRILGATRSIRHSNEPLRVPPGDDAAVLSDGTVLTTDMLIEGRHWDDRLSPEDVGYKAVAVSVSDLAAMGATPTWMLLNLAVPGDDPWIIGFTNGLRAACIEFKIDLVGGDTVSTSGPRVVAVQLAGRLIGPVMTRRGAQAGHSVLVSGIPGLAGAGYLSDKPHADALAALRRPRPQQALAIAIAPYVSAAMDLSDGLVHDLPRLCRASGVGAIVDADALPDHPALHVATVPRRTLQLAAGDDYELLFTVPHDQVHTVVTHARSLGTNVHVIGRCTESMAVRPRSGAWPAPPWQHFPAGAL